jgi:hypothetical protein
VVSPAAATKAGGASGRPLRRISWPTAARIRPTSPDGLHPCRYDDPDETAQDAVDAGRGELEGGVGIAE